jgi:hypothetical protein
MEPDFSYLAAAATTEELTERIANRKNYLPETVEAAVAELKFVNMSLAKNLILLTTILNCSAKMRRWLIAEKVLIVTLKML